MTPEAKQLRAVLDVYDVTLQVVGVFLPPLPEWAQRQVDTAQQAYREVTGDEPLSLSRPANDPRHL